MARVRLEEIRLGPNVSAGMNLVLVSYMTYRLRTEVVDPFPPIAVRTAPGGYQLVDGRHRLVSHMAAGRRDIDVAVVQ
jgi:hypothetical protein